MDHAFLVIKRADLSAMSPYVAEDFRAAPK
jgi:hypothetical protein